MIIPTIIASSGGSMAFSEKGCSAGAPFAFVVFGILFSTHFSISIDENNVRTTRRSVPQWAEG
ncbi:hypothetical protein D3C75_753060 [compost metagenome]